LFTPAPFAKVPYFTPVVTVQVPLAHGNFQRFHTVLQLTLVKF